MNTIRFTSCQSPNAEPVLIEIARWLSEQLGQPIQFVNDISWQERYAQLDAGEVDAAWICGLPYVTRADAAASQIELLCAPVMQGDRYASKPIYFSDVVVRSDSAFQRFEDLRGTRWAINERGSHSGYNVVRWYLANHGLNGDFFGSVIESGGHLLSLQLVLNGEVDAAAIDSTVLETELRSDPTLAQRIRVIEAMGPSPIPPYVVQKSLPNEDKRRLRQAFLTIHEDSRGRHILAKGGYERFVAVTDADYDVTREMAQIADTVTL
ncbi:MAG: PhnD/SsuA/transferrin family substrate-binding protein [Anaerolineae bacterium]|nr:PhnD/SsuA/transferrin family substrate-binding protein [Anaerolineae bacterium]